MTKEDDSRLISVIVAPIVCRLRSWCVYGSYTTCGIDIVYPKDVHSKLPISDRPIVVFNWMVLIRVLGPPQHIDGRFELVLTKFCLEVSQSRELSFVSHAEHKSHRPLPVFKRGSIGDRSICFALKFIFLSPV